MGTTTNEMVRRAVDSILTGDLDLADLVVQSDDEVDGFEKSAFNKAIVAVMQEAPVARDLRFLIATLGVVGEIEKAGDDAVKLARRATKIHQSFPAEMKLTLVELGEQARRSFAGAIRLYAEYDPALAEEIVHGDKAIDTAYSRARNRVFDLIRVNPAATEHLVRTIECFHALEHVADHSVAIAVRMRMVHEAAADALSNQR